jgi:Fic family protein
MRGIYGIFSAEGAENMRYIHELDIWPKFIWDDQRIASALGAARNRQGRLLGRMESLGFPMRSEAILQTLTLDIVKSSEIEGDILDPRQVRSSLARRLGISIAGLVPSDRHVDGVVEMMLDATQHFDQPLTKERLFGWHSCLFPSGRSGMHKIAVGAWRDDRLGSMRVVSGPLGDERVHFEAPCAGRVNNEMKRFMNWFNAASGLDPVIKSAIAHLWFVTIHPFEDGNGRIARAIADMLLARADGTSARFYSMSVQIRQERAAYYDALEKAQKNTHGSKTGIDITIWLVWFLGCLDRAIAATEITLSGIFRKVRFWETHPQGLFNERQRVMINKLLDGFEGKLTSSKWAKLAKCSPDTALRDISDLLEKSIFAKDTAGGRSTSYFLKSFKEQ